MKKTEVRPIRKTSIYPDRIRDIDSRRISLKNKKLVVFDLDGTLAPSKSVIDPEMSDLLSQLLKKKKVAIISGGALKQFESQFLSSLNCSSALLKNLSSFRRVLQVSINIGKMDGKRYMLKNFQIMRKKR